MSVSFKRLCLSKPVWNTMKRRRNMCWNMSCHETEWIRRRPRVEDHGKTGLVSPWKSLFMPRTSTNPLHFSLNARVIKSLRHRTHTSVEVMHRHREEQHHRHLKESSPAYVTHATCTIVVAGQLLRVTKRHVSPPLGELWFTCPVALHFKRSLLPASCSWLWSAPPRGLV